MQAHCCVQYAYITNIIGEADQSTARLSGLSRPKVGTGATRYKRQKVFGKTAKSKGTQKGRNFGKLVQLMNMPLDVFFEASHNRTSGIETVSLDFSRHRLPHNLNLLTFCTFRAFRSNLDPPLPPKTLAIFGLPQGVPLTSSPFMSHR
jgi:hypothetical protein